VHSFSHLCIVEPLEDTNLIEAWPVGVISGVLLQAFFVDIAAVDSNRKESIIHIFLDGRTVAVLAEDRTGLFIAFKLRTSVVVVVGKEPICMAAVAWEVALAWMSARVTEEQSAKSNSFVWWGVRRYVPFKCTIG